MNKEEIKQIKKYFHQYTENEDGKLYMHNVEDYFHIVITPEGEVYQLDTDHALWGAELETVKSLRVRFESFTGELFEITEDEFEIDRFCSCPDTEKETRYGYGVPVCFDCNKAVKLKNT